MKTIQFVYPQDTKTVSLSGGGCALNCSHCNKHYIKQMDTLDSPAPESTKSYLISGGLKKNGESFILDFKEKLLQMKKEGKYHFNSHVGFVAEKDIDAMAEVVDYVSYDFVSDSDVIKRVYKLDKTVEEYIELYKRLSTKIKTYPHITIGLDAGKIHWEYEAIDILHDLGADRLVLNVLIPTAGTEFADVPNPDLQEVRKVMEHARMVFRGKPLIVGCMRPPGKYRSEFDEMAVDIGVDRIVQPTANARDKAEKAGMKISYLYECCALDTQEYSERHPGHKKATLPLDQSMGGCCSAKQPASPSEKDAVTKTDGKIRLSLDAGTQQSASPQQSKTPCGGSRTTMDSKMRLSIDSAVKLDLKKSRMRPKTNTIYLMNSGGCEYSCSFCSQAKTATSEEDKLSRISWPEYETEDVLDAIEDKEGVYKRVCMQVVNTKGALEKLPDTVRNIRQKAPNTKIAMTIRTYMMSDVDKIFKAGADEIGLSIDAIDPEQFARIKGGDFASHKKFVLDAADKYPGKIATHLIVGMGETEQQVVELMQELHEHQIIIALFAFTPVKGSAMEDVPPPDVHSYRRIQIALHLIRNYMQPNIRYTDDGAIVDFGYDKDKLFDLLKDSNVFETSGCSDCNRPYYNERAGAKELYNHPEKLKEDRFTQVFESVFVQ